MPLLPNWSNVEEPWGFDALISVCDFYIEHALCADNCSGFLVIGVNWVGCLMSFYMLQEAYNNRRVRWLPPVFLEMIKHLNLAVNWGVYPTRRRLHVWSQVWRQPEPAGVVCQWKMHIVLQAVLVPRPVPVEPWIYHSLRPCDLSSTIEGGEIDGWAPGRR